MPPIFNVNTASFNSVTVADYLEVTGSIFLNNVSIENTVKSNKIERTILTASYGNYIIPSWAEEVEVIAIGCGGAGGGGVSVTGSHLALGAGGGSGAGVSYKFYFTPQSQSFLIRYIIGVEAIGGESCIGGSPVISSVQDSLSQHADYVARHGSISSAITNESFYGLSPRYALLAHTNIKTMYTGSKGMNGSRTVAWLIQSSSQGELIQAPVIAEGGEGGYGGISIEFNDTSPLSPGVPQNPSVYNQQQNSSAPVSAWWPFVESVVSTENLVGGLYTNSNKTIGGPGGYGVAQPISKTLKSDIIYSTPPMTVNRYLDQNLQSSVNIPQQDITEYSPTSIVTSNILYVRHNGKLQNKIFSSPYSFLTAVKGPTGGAGGNGRGTPTSEPPYDVFDRDDLIIIGKAGTQRLNKNIDFYEFGQGGDGGNSQYRSNPLLLPTPPTTGSGFGAGGGGGASDFQGGNVHSGANGNRGAVIVIVKGTENVFNQNQNDQQ